MIADSGTGATMEGVMGGDSGNGVDLGESSCFGSLEGIARVSNAGGVMESGSSKGGTGVVAGDGLLD